MRVIGLTGSIGAGKSTTAAMFAARGVPVHDADAAVHRLYQGRAAAKLEAAFPGVTVGGVVDRARLSERVVGDADALKRLEAIVHPLVRESEREFLERKRGEGCHLAVVDVPLLFEAGGADRVDIVVVVTAAAEILRARVLARPGMTEAKLEALLKRQVPDAEKRRRAHFVIDSGRGFEAAGRAVDAILRALASTL
ncbi:MAG: dephospho-CoA kinase [Propylenella sp.]